jgi:hypothetical protein
VVRDEDLWSALVPLVQEPNEPVERFGMFSFHFPAGVDNSGFVGWLATLLTGRLIDCVGLGLVRVSRRVDDLPDWSRLVA